MLKGLALTPPIIGRISIGKVVEKDGRRLPDKDDQFSITSQVQNREGGWVSHPLDAELRKTPETKLRSIPVRLLFDDPDLSLRANYTLFDRRSGRPVCVGNGETCRRASRTQGIEVLPCLTPQSCEFNTEGLCKPYGRLNVRIDVEVDGADELGSFAFRTTGFNSIRTLSSRLKYFQAVSGGALAALPLELRLRGKSTAASFRSPIYYVDLTVRGGMSTAQALASARALVEERKEAGFDQAALDEAARQGFALGAFEESEEEAAAVIEEFFPEVTQEERVDTTGASGKLGLADKLARRVTAMSAAGPADAGGHQGQY